MFTGNPDDLRGGSSRLEQAILHVLAPLAACLVWLSCLTLLVLNRHEAAGLVRDLARALRTSR